MKKHLIPLFSFLTLLLSLVALTSCIKKQTETSIPPLMDAPEETVRKFVQMSAAVKTEEDKRKLLELCQGELRRAFERMTPEAFRVAYLSNSVKLKEFKILESKVTEKAARISYQVSLENSQGSDTTLEINTREVELILAGQTWLIENIRAKGTDTIAFTRGMIF